MARAAVVDTLRGAESTEASYLRAGQEMARRTERLVAVWDGLPARGPSGTASIVAFARAAGKPVVHLDTTARRIVRLEAS